MTVKFWKGAWESCARSWCPIKQFNDNIVKSKITNCSHIKTELMKPHNLWKHPTSYPYQSIPKFLLWQVHRQVSQKSMESPNEHIFSLRDLDRWPMILTYKLDLGIRPLDFHAKIQVPMAVHLAGIARRTDRHTGRRCQNYYTPQVRDVRCNKYQEMANRRLL